MDAILSRPQCVNSYWEIWKPDTQTARDKWVAPGEWTDRQWASYQIRKIADCACAGNAGYVFPRRRIQRKPLVGDPGMPHGTCVTHVPWGMSGSLTCGDGENVPGIPGACAPAILRIWQEVHVSFFLWIRMATDIRSINGAWRTGSNAGFDILIYFLSCYQVAFEDRAWIHET